MTRKQELKRESDIARFEVDCCVDLVRGCSIIASTLTTASRRAAVAEILDTFVAEHGGDMAAVFLERLAVRLERHKDVEAATAVRHAAKLQ